MKTNLPKLKSSSYFLIVAILLTGFISFLCWLISFPGIRRVYNYSSLDGTKTFIEVRYAPVNPVQGNIAYYVDELLLGPIQDQGSPIFVRGTKVNSCFERDGILYVDLSKDLLAADPINTDFNKKIELFKRNIKHNFGYIKEIVLFIDGKIPFEKEIKPVTE